MVYQTGPIDLVAVNDSGDIMLLDSKTDTTRVNPGKIKPTRIHRPLKELQKNIGVQTAYISADGEVQIMGKPVHKRKNKNVRKDKTASPDVQGQTKNSRRSVQKG